MAWTYSCVCGKQYSSRSGLQYHQAVSTSCRSAVESPAAKDFVCDRGECSKSFSTKKSLARHVRCDHPAVVDCNTDRGKFSCFVDVWKESTSFRRAADLEDHCLKNYPSLLGNET